MYPWCMKMEDVSHCGLIYILSVIIIGHVQASSSSPTTLKSIRNDSDTEKPGDTGDSGSGSFKIYPTVYVVFVLALMTCCLGTCCGVTARRRANLQRRRAAQQRQMANGYASLMIAVIADLMSYNSQDNGRSTEPGDLQPRTEFKGPPTYEEVTKDKGDAPPPYSALDLCRAISVKQSDT